MRRARAALSQETRDLRERLLRVLYRLIVAGGAVALVPSLYLSVQEGLWLVLAADILAFLAAICLAFLPGLPFRLRVIPLLGLFYLLGVLLIVFTGPYGAGHLYLFAFAFLAALFGGKAFLIGANLLSILSHAALAAANAAGLLPWEQGLGSVVVIASNFAFVSLLLSFSAHYLINGFAASAAEERRMRDALELMLQEIEHRVKNNLQVISSLVNLKSGPGVDPNEAIENIKASLSAISSVHQLLVRRDSSYAVRIRILLEALAARYRSLHGRLEFRLGWEGEDAEMDGESAVDLGLLVNELILNSVKHAFPGGRRGLISILGAYDQASRELIIRFADDGVGQAAGPSPEGRGLKIVEALAKHLEGRLEREAGPGWAYRLSLRLPPLA